MKKTGFTLFLILTAGLINAQTQANKPLVSGKISVSKGQKILIKTTVSIESSMSGMEVSNNTSSENTLEVKNAADKSYTISNTLTKLKVNIDMMGQSTSYDSDKKEDQDTDIGKSLGDKLNKPVDVVIDNSTGLAAAAKQTEQKKDLDSGNPMQGLMQMFGNNSDDAIVSGAFELIPAGKNVGDSWSDTSIEKDLKIFRTYSLRSIADSGAVIQLNAIMESVSSVEIQGMQMDVNSTTQSTSEILTDIATAQVKRKSTQATTTGSFQVMGQSVPLNAKATTVSIYQ